MTLLHSVLLHQQQPSTASQQPPDTPVKHQPPTSASPSPSRVSRCLFGRPDPKEQRDWLRERLDGLLEESSSLWGFDFATETPLDRPATSSDDSSDQDVGCDWEWSRLPVGKLPSPYQPAVYVNQPMLKFRNRKASTSSASTTSTSPSSADSSFNSSSSDAAAGLSPSPTITGYFASRKRSHQSTSTSTTGGGRGKVVDTPSRRRVLAAGGQPQPAAKIARLRLATRCNGEQ